MKRLNIQNWANWGLGKNRAAALSFAIFECIALGGLVASQSAWAESATPASRIEEDSYNFSWLDPDKKIYVLQNRRYLKSPRLLFSLLGGVSNSDPYQSTQTVGGRLAFYFTEQFGVEGFVNNYFNQDNNVYEALKKQNGNRIPVIRLFEREFGGLLHYSPWYAKINVYNTIFYFDWYFTAGAGLAQTNLDQRPSVNSAPKLKAQSLSVGYIGTGHQYHFHEHWIFRVDILGSIFPAPTYGDTGDSVLFSHWAFTGGIGFRL